MFLIYVFFKDLTAVGTSERVSTAAYSAILSASGDLLYGIGDFGIHDEVSPQHVSIVLI